MILSRLPNRLLLGIVVALFGAVASANQISAGTKHRNSAVLKGVVNAGERVTTPFGDEFFFVLTPIEHGWQVSVTHDNAFGNLARLTPPWHFVPNPRYIEGWHFRNRSNTGPNEGSVNTPQKLREFIFSPEAIGSIKDEVLGRKPTPEEIEAIGRFGKGRLEILDFELTGIKPGHRASLIRMNYRVCLSWACDANSEGTQ